jgi:hypothetical protein
MQSRESVYLDSTLCDSLRSLSSENSLDDLVNGILEAYVERRSNEDEIIAKYISVTPVIGRLDKGGNTILPSSMYDSEDDVYDGFQ